PRAQAGRHGVGPCRRAGPAGGSESAATGPGARDRIPAPLSTDAGFSLRAPRASGRSAVLEDRGLERLEGPPGPRPPARLGACRAAGAGEPRSVLRGALMPWPEPIGVLLARPDSRASQALRSGLRGLRSSLEAAVEELPDGDGCRELRGLLAELNSLLGSSAPTAGQTLPLDNPETMLPDDRAD